ncbi:hypothetical protein IHE45_06G062100 [Dioscorea alata]|uniref:Uncharacterized protein n=1 Tax=Dioscorea alata TaxID=55571 RepID=A0ACB7VXP7_DIOAL|nr:hypothetical protein IHE45_06G062100 [Dioscorea alata]
MDLSSDENFGLLATITYLYAEMMNKLAILVYVIALERRRRRKRPRIAYDRSHPGAVGLRNKPFPCLEELSQVFGKDRATGEGAEAPADAVEDIENEETAGYTEPSIGDAFVDLDGEENTSVPGLSPINATTTATSQPGSSQDAHQKKVKRKRSLGQDIGNDEFSSTISSIGTWIDSSGEHISRLASCFQFLSDEAEAKKKVYTELLKIEGLSQLERIRAGGLIVSDTSKVSYLFSLPYECKKDYVTWVLGGCQ